MTIADKSFKIPSGRKRIFVGTKKVSLSKVFGRKLSKLMAEQKLNTTSLGEKLDVSPATVSRWKNGLQAPTLAHLEAIGQVFNVTPESLISKGDLEHVVTPVSLGGEPSSGQHAQS